MSRRLAHLGSGCGLAVATLLALAPAHAAIKPSSPPAIAAAVADCWQAANAVALDETALRGKGWQSARLRTPGGGRADTPMTVLVKPGSDVIITLAKKVDPRGCTVTARVDKIETITVAAKEIYRQLQAIEPGLEVKQPTPAEVAYFAPPKAALLRPSGSKDEPATTIQVSYTAPEKK